MLLPQSVLAAYARLLVRASLEATTLMLTLAHTPEKVPKTGMKRGGPAGMIFREIRLPNEKRHCQLNALMKPGFKSLGPQGATVPSPAQKRRVERAAAAVRKKHRRLRHQSTTPTLTNSCGTKCLSTPLNLVILNVLCTAALRFKRIVPVCRSLPGARR